MRAHSEKVTLYQELFYTSASISEVCFKRGLMNFCKICPHQGEAFFATLMYAAPRLIVGTIEVVAGLTLYMAVGIGSTRLGVVAGNVETEVHRPRGKEARRTRKRR